MGNRTIACALFYSLAPQVGLEPTTLRLTAECSAIELLRSVWLLIVLYQIIRLNPGRQKYCDGALNIHEI